MQLNQGKYSKRIFPTSSRACEPVLEVETDLAYSGAQLRSVSSSLLVIL